MIYLDDQPGYRLVWSDEGPRAGLEVTVNVTSMSAQLAAEEFSDVVKQRSLQPKDLRRLAREFMDHVEAWNVVRDGRPAPVTVRSFLRLHRDQVVMPVMREWLRMIRLAALDEIATAPEVEQAVEDPAVDFASLIYNEGGQRPLTERGEDEVELDEVELDETG